VCRWRICGSTFSLSVRAFRVGRLPLVSLSSGPRLSASSSPPRCPTPAVSPPIFVAPPLPVPPAPHFGCRRAITAPITSPPSNRASTRRNELNYSAIEAPPHRPLLTGICTPSSPAPLQKASTTPGFTAPLPASLLFSPCLSIALTEHRRHRFYTAVARPPRRSSTSGEALDRTPVSSSFFLSSRGELLWTREPVGRATVSSSGRRWRPVHGGPKRRWSTTRGPSSRDYLFKNKSEIPLFQTFFI
jgi:hypothetical protein